MQRMRKSRKLIRGDGAFEGKVKREVESLEEVKGIVTGIKRGNFGRF